MKAIYISMILACSNLCSNDLVQESCNNVSDIQEKVCYSETFNRIIITSSLSDYTLDESQNVVIWKANVPSQDSLIRQLQSYIGQNITSDQLLAIKKTIVNHYQLQNRPLITVIIPEQEVNCGIVVFHVFEGKIGCISMKGNRWYSDELIYKTLNIEPQGEFDNANALNNLAWLNRNPFHQSEIVLAPAQTDSTDIEVLTKDRFPLRSYIGMDNTGTQYTGKTRWYAGINWSTPYYINDLLTYQFTGGLNLHQFHAHYANYIVFLPNYNILSLAGGFAAVHPKITNYSNEGKSAFASFRYTVPFLPFYGAQLQEMSFGADYKNLNSNLLFINDTQSIPLITSDLNIFELVLSYKYSKAFSNNEICLNLENFFSPGSLVIHHQGTDYQKLREGAHPLFDYVRLNFDYKYNFTDLSIFHADFRGQMATGSLVASEQFGLGGLYTIRGYEEREFNADKALCVNLEWYATPWQDLCRQVNSKLTFLAFMDFGYGTNYNNSAGNASSNYLWSVGPGVRFYLNPYVIARFDMGIKLHKLTNDHRFGMAHFSITASY